MSKKPCFRRPLDRQQGNLVETLLQSEWLQLYNIYSLLWRYFHLKKSHLVIHKILRLFVSTLTVDEKHYLLTRDNFIQTIQTQLSQKRKSFWQFLFAFLKAILNFKNFPKNVDPHSWCISGNTGSEEHV